MRLSLKVSGMTCVNCARAIELNLRRLHGVKDVKVSFELGRVWVEIEEELISPQDVVAVIESLGYRVEDSLTGRDFSAVVLALCYILSVPIVFLMFLHQPWSLYLQALLAGVVQLVGGWSFYRSAYLSARAGVGNMDLLVAVGSTTAYLYSLLSLVGFLKAHPMFETSALLITFVRTGKWVEDRFKKRATRKLRDLFGFQTVKVRVLGPKGEEEKSPSEVFKGDRVILRKGDLIPVDGHLQEGTVWLDQSLITGESEPVKMEAGALLLSGSLVVDGYGVMKVEKTFSGSYVSFLIKLVEKALSEKPNIQRISDKIAHYFVQGVLILALLVFAFWMWRTHDLERSLTYALAVVVVSCPCAFGIAVPLAIVVGLSRAYSRGILIKEPSIFEREVDVVFLDKTGTVTEGKPKVVKVRVRDEEALRVAHALSSLSNHPYSKAIREYTANLGISADPPSHCKEVVGVGILCDEYALKGKENGWVAIYRGEEVLAEFYVEDTLREDAPQAVDQLKRMGLKVVMLTGDREERAKSISDALGIEEWYASVKPEDKMQVLEEYQKRGYRVCMVGDGINDAPALAKADMSVAMGSGTEVAKLVGDVVLLGGIGGLVELFRIKKTVSRRIKQNLFWAFSYNVLLIPVAAGGLASFGISLKPEWAGLLMVLSSVAVVINSVRP
ncbi:heavy metal translocating P-type ATPase [Thermocrinis albus]|nr:cation-translocating P-type ATPase [Thermocrinis albus]